MITGCRRKRGFRPNERSCPDHGLMDQRFPPSSRVVFCRMRFARYSLNASPGTGSGSGWSARKRWAFTLLMVPGLLVILGSAIAGAQESVPATETPAVLEIRELPPEKVLVSIDRSQLGPRIRLLLLYSAAILFASLVGGYLPEIIRLTHTRLQVLISFVGGLMLGVALFHLLLHALLDSSRAEIPTVLTSLALGVLTMFLLLRVFHFHQHDVTPAYPGIEQTHHQPCEHSAGHMHTEPQATGEPLPEEQAASESESSPPLGSPHRHVTPPNLNRGETHPQATSVATAVGSELSESADLRGASAAAAEGESGLEQAVVETTVDESLLERHPATNTPLGRHRFSWIGIALGLSLHSIMDGIALTASLLRPIAMTESAPSWGLATFLAIVLHKPLDAISITSVMSASGWSRGQCTLANLAFAMMCPLGAALAFWGIMGTHSHAYVISQLLAFSAGIFLCISLSDLLPEMQFHGHNQILLTLSLLAGLAVAWLLMFINPMHPV